MTDRTTPASRDDLRAARLAGLADRVLFAHLDDHGHLPLSPTTTIADAAASLHPIDVLRMDAAALTLARFVAAECLIAIRRHRRASGA